MLPAAPILTLSAPFLVLSSFEAISLCPAGMVPQIQHISSSPSAFSHWKGRKFPSQGSWLAKSHPGCCSPCLAPSFNPPALSRFCLIYKYLHAAVFILLPASNNIFQGLLGGWCTIRVNSWCLKFSHFPRFVKQLITKGCSCADISPVSSSSTFSQTFRKILIPFWCFNTSHSFLGSFLHGGGETELAHK